MYLNLSSVRNLFLFSKEDKMKKLIFTSESVTEGHPDKVCDQISDAVLDAIIADDKNARVACETLTSTGLILVAGEITTDTYVDIKSVARETVREIGYDDPKYGFSADFIISDENAKYILAFVNLGLVPDTGATYLLSKSIGVTRTLELAATGRPLDAKEAKEWGLIYKLAKT